jgi:hypothetical protein
LALLIVSLVGLIFSMLKNFDIDEFDAYGEVSIPATRTLHLPAGDVTVSFHSTGIAHTLSLPDDLEMTITPPSGVAEPTVTQDWRGNEANHNGDAHRSWRAAHIAQAGDYTIKTNGKVTDYDSPRVSFGHPSRYWFVTWLFAGLSVVSGVAIRLTMVHRGTRSARTAAADWPPFSFTDTEVRSSAPPPAVQPNRQTLRDGSLFGYMDDAAEPELRRQNWAAIDRLVEEFFPEAIRRETRTQGVFREHWLVRSGQSKRYHLVILTNRSWRDNGKSWSLRGEDNGYIVELTSSVDPNKKGPRETSVVDSLREGALRLLNS